MGFGDGGSREESAFERWKDFGGELGELTVSSGVACGGEGGLVDAGRCNRAERGRRL